jgi:hypothetical protein
VAELADAQDLASQPSALQPTRSGRHQSCGSATAEITGVTNGFVRLLPQTCLSSLIL